MVPPVKVLFQEGWSERQPALAPRPLSWSFTSDTEHMATPMLISLESTAPSGQTPASHHGPHLSDGKWAQRRDAASRGSSQARGGPWGVPPPRPPPPRSVPSST